MAKQNKNTGKRIKLALLFTSVALIIFFGLILLLKRDVHFEEYPEFGIPIPTEYEIHGIDVSRYQQEIDWYKVYAMHTDDLRLTFAFIKATEGADDVDPFFAKNWRRAKVSGLVRGAYHFFVPSKDGKMQADNFIKHVKLRSGDLPPVLDVEQIGKVHEKVLREELLEWLLVLEERYDVKPIIYTNVDFYKRYLKGHFDDYPLWVAHYLQKNRPRIDRSWSFWQHSESGKVNGIQSKVDFNVFNGDSSQFRALLVP
jgi:lysozyme